MVLIVLIWSYKITLVVASDRMLSVKIPEKMLSEIDEVSERIGHNSRSDFVKTAIRFYLQMIHEKEVWEKEK